MNFPVRLIAYTQPVIEELGSAEDLIAYCARVSNPSNQLNTETADKLLKYLIKHKHWSPFEMVSATIEINTTRDIARQILRHRSFSFQEFSQRYAEVDADPIWREAREQDPNNRQNSRHVANMKFREQFLERQLQVWHHAWTNYKLALKEGVAKEQARALLPEGLTPSKLYMAGTLRSWLHFIELRSANGTQMEHQEIAKQCAKVLTPVFRSIFQSNSNGE